MIRPRSTLSFTWLVLCLTFGPAAAAAGADRAWEDVLLDLRARRDGLRDALTRARDALESQARDARRDLSARLVLDPAPLLSGYGILPDVSDDDPPAAVAIQQSIYSLARLDERFAAAESGTARLIENGRAAAAERLEARVAEFERLRDDLRNLEQHLSYHDYWQQAVVDHPRFYAERNRLVLQARELQRLLADEGPADRVAALREEIVGRVAPFATTAGLAIRRTPGGGLRLPLTLCTDIEDRRFLKAFRQGVDAAFRRSPAARSRRFAVELTLRRVPPRRLYPDGPPAPGAAVDLSDHRSRFADCPLVLTTGAESTHAWLGDSIFLGPATLSRRVLAHEFGHLLGFSDAYIRGYDGEIGGPFGAVIVEWTGITDDLMGNPGHGRVSEAMIDRLIEAYGAADARRPDPRDDPRPGQRPAAPSGSGGSGGSCGSDGAVRRGNQ